MRPLNSACRCSEKVISVALFLLVIVPWQQIEKVELMKNYLTSLMACVVLTFASAGYVSAQDAPNLIGKWKGQSEGLGSSSGYVSGPVTIDVTEQRGRAFRATIEYPSSGASDSDPLVGVITADGKTIYFAGDDGFHVGSLEGNVLDTCYVQSGDKDTMAVCTKFEKQP